MERSHPTQRGALPFPLVACLLCMLLAACHPRHRVPPDQETGTASLRAALQESLSGSRSAFLPPACLALLPKGTETSIRLPSPEESAAACSKPSGFHMLHRAFRFDRVFLVPGPFCAALRDRLLDSPVWVLSQVRPEGYLFTVAGPPSWHPPDASEAARLQPDPDARSLWLIGTAENLIAIGHSEEAAGLLNLAACSRKHESQRLAALASLEAACGHWNKALSLCRESLRLDRRNRSANLILIRALVECGNPEEALAKARAFSSASPDAETLFLLARSANAAGDHAEEISALRHLVSIARKEGQPAGASLLYLGQALARDGQRGEALRVLEEAAAAPELTDKQRRLIRELLDNLAPNRE